MEEYKITEFKAKLKALLEEYDVSIGFSCGESSDPYGLYEDRIVIQTNKSPEKNIYESGSWWILAKDL